MEISEQYCMYRLAYYFVMEEKYDMLHINNDRNEVWLEKRHKKIQISYVLFRVDLIGKTT